MTPQLNYAAPLEGTEQSVQKAEVVAVAHAIARVPKRVHLFVDNKYVLDTLVKVMHGGLPRTKKHCTYWQFILQHRDRIADATWIKSHMETEEEAIAKGFTEEDRLGNQKADELANKGRDMHTTNLTVVNAYRRLLKHVGDV